MADYDTYSRNRIALPESRGGISVEDDTSTPSSAARNEDGVGLVVGSDCVLLHSGLQATRDVPRETSIEIAHDQRCS